jgi:hypothetical protein
MQASDGNFVIYTADDVPVAEAGIRDEPGAYLMVGDDGVVRIVRGSDGTILREYPPDQLYQ